ncbi:AAA family ATPase [Gloeothece verrucosa]|uniref:Magnesium chelatase n=1 Tax=Gloeothece verrucosa (strain PCC 7822) TaxID=497965 RepID=E0U8A0_GLOV7|nr:AAA family ATPase [Gloeothece verrucosa]ADN12536.1 Magnesium chelatase [Gloeothece verrucosa PCC 7822]
MNTISPIPILPYSRIVGQEQLKLALEIAYIAPRLGGVLISGHRGTGKSTAVRAFSQMLYGDLPVTLPINATEDRVVGGWKIDELMQSKAVWQAGLLEEAAKKLLYVDEINLLDDHIVNIILDVTSTGVLVVQREGQSEQKALSFTLVGTMNPEEGGLRPQLLDRFGLMVSVTAEMEEQRRLAILQNVLAFEEALVQLDLENKSEFLELAKKENQEKVQQLKAAKEKVYSIKVASKALNQCITLGKRFQVEGNRGDFILAMAARACAALQGAETVNSEHIRAVVPLALQHRRPEMAQSNQGVWHDQDNETVAEILESE